jgi:hypothetical protein
MTSATMSPVHMRCTVCRGNHGRLPPDWALCTRCDGLGYEWVPGAPAFGCMITLAERRPGEVVVLGNGDRGRILRHDRRGTPTTILGLIGDFDGQEDTDGTWYPSCVGVASVASPVWLKDPNAGHVSDGSDILDPLRKKISAL